MPEEILFRRLLLPELRFVRSWSRPYTSTVNVAVRKVSEVEVCPRCATPSRAVYDHRTVVIKDAPIRQHHVLLHLRKRRFSCRPCRRPFTEPVPGIRKRGRVTERYRRSVLWACETFSDLKAVRHQYRCSAGFVYKNLYAQLELQRRHRQYPWPSAVGIDEHFFGKDRLRGFRRFASVLVDLKNHRVMELVDGRHGAVLEASLADIPGREHVRFVVLDMSDAFRSFARRFFPDARLVADKFHVLRLLHPALSRRRKAIPGDANSAAVRRLLLHSAAKLDFFRRIALRRWLDLHPELCELYRTRGAGRAARALDGLVARFAASALPELNTLARTLARWRSEVLAYFDTGLTNGMTEGFNNKAKLVKRRAFGYRSFQNYRLRLLNACSG
jgi:transposase